MVVRSLVGQLVYNITMDISNIEVSYLGEPCFGRHGQIPRVGSHGPYENRSPVLSYLSHLFFHSGWQCICDS